MSPAADAKLHPALRARLAASADAQRETVTVLVKLAPGRDAAPLATLGFTLGGTFGDVVTGTIALGAIERLAESDAVIYVEAARPLGYDAR